MAKFSHVINTALFNMVADMLKSHDEPNDLFKLYYRIL